MKIDGMTVLEKIYQRASSSVHTNHVIIATSNHHTDDEIFDLCMERNMTVFRGPLDNVLERYYLCAKEYSADIIVRLTADCPLVSRDTIDEAISLYLKNKYDFIANTVPPEKSTYPDGSDVGVFSFDVLENAYREDNKFKSDEHVTFQFWKDQSRYSSYIMTTPNDSSDYRYTLDYPEDFDVIKFIYHELSRLNLYGSVKEIVEILRNNDDIRNYNSKYKQGDGWKQ
jgi:spore coat polysaccharide biosynthesis protein SpsF